MMRAHPLVERRRARIGINGHPGRTEIAGLRRCPLEQQPTYPRPQQRGFNEELQKLRVLADDLDLSEASNRGIALGHL